MKHLLIRWLVNAAALFAAIHLVPGLHFNGTTVQLFALAAVFGIVNAVLRPILTVLTCPLVVLTLGLFTLVLNALLLFATEWLAQGWGLDFRVDGFWPAFFGGLLIGIVSAVLTIVVGERRREE